MPFAPLWLPRIPDAVAQLQQIDQDLITRADLQVLFGVSRALAAKLMHRFGAKRVGAQLVLERSALIERLEQMAGGEPARLATARQAGVASELRKARLRAVHVAVPASVLQTHIAGLPAGVTLGPGRIEVQFGSVPEALQKLFTLAQAITNDYDRFAVLVSVAPESDL